MLAAPLAGVGGMACGWDPAMVEGVSVEGEAVEAKGEGKDCEAGVPATASGESRSIVGVTKSTLSAA